MLTTVFHRLAFWIERRFEPLFRARPGRSDAITVDPHIGYATPQHLILRGRLLKRPTMRPARNAPSRFANFRDTLALFLTNELTNIEVRCGEVTARSDEEGYFQLLLPRGEDESPGWRRFDVCVSQGAEQVESPVLIARKDARCMIISDIDDTVMQTGAYSLRRNLWTTFTGNIKSRHVFPDAVAFMQTLSQEGRNPVYYVSSSPWNLHAYLTQVFARAGLVRGPLFLRDLGLSRTKFITDGHGSHKGQSIDILMEANPTLPAVLVGDTGQKDATIYKQAIARHPGRVCAVVLRTPRPERNARLQSDVEALQATGVPVHAARSFEGFAPRVLATLPEN